MPTLACDLTAIRPIDRPRHRALLARVREAIRERRSLPGGYKYRLIETEVGLIELAEWIAFERLCCPFLRFTVAVSGAEPDWWLHLMGPPGVKRLLDLEFPFP